MKNFKFIKSKNDISKEDSYNCYIIEAQEKVCRSIIESLHSQKYKGKIGVIGGENKFNRRAIETLKINYLISPEKGKKIDTLKQRDSGLNHVIAKEAAKKKIEIIIDLDEIALLKGLPKAKRIARIIQNIKICRKAKSSIKIISFSKKFDEKQIKAIGQSFGMSSKEIKNCLIK